MESDFEENQLATKESFWKGIAAGFLAGIGVAAALRYTPFEKFITGTVEGKLDHTLTAFNEPVVPVAAETTFYSRRDQPESAGDPRNLASDRTGAAAEFVRRGGAPGGLADAEILEVPGRPGERIDHVDLAQPEKRYRRYFDMGSAG